MWHFVWVCLSVYCSIWLCFIFFLPNNMNNLPLVINCYSDFQIHMACLIFSYLEHPFILPLKPLLGLWVSLLQYILATAIYSNIISFLNLMLISVNFCPCEYQSSCVRRPKFIVCTGGNPSGYIPTHSNQNSTSRYYVGFSLN